ncbi:MAG: glutamyl-tRNA reductase [Solirubrobacterales bacterium]
MYILLAGLSHRTAPVEIRERMAITGTGLQAAYAALGKYPALHGTVILSTCNRTEIYATVRDVDEGAKALRAFVADRLNMAEEDLVSVLYQPNCYDAILHLFRVTSGLDSMVLGETEILGQVKDAYACSIEHRGADRILHSLFQKAIYVGKRARTETNMDQHAVSISTVAVEMARQVFGELEGRTVIVIGAGQMSELALKYLVANGVSGVVVSNRSYERAAGLAAQFNGQAIQLDRLSDHIAKADIIISCTAATHYVLRRDDLQPLLENRERPLLLIDIAVPRDIDPAVAEIPGVFLHDIDDLKNVVDANLEARKTAARQAESIITEELDEFNDWLATQYVIPVVKALKGRAEAIKEVEIARTLNKLGKVSAKEEQMIRSMASSIVNQLLHFPVVNLKEVAATNQGHLYAEVVKKLFQLEIAGEENGEYVEDTGRVQGQ